MVRRVINWVAGVVLGLSVVAWAASYTESSWVRLHSGYGVLLDGGGVYVSRGLAVPVVNPYGGPGVGSTAVYSKQDFVIPLWLTLTLSLAAMWGVWRFGLEERRRAVERQCAGCGYDLEGIAGVCPECGGAP